MADTKEEYLELKRRIYEKLFRTSGSDVGAMEVEMAFLAEGDWSTCD